jgi:hypothetical protein
VKNLRVLEHLDIESTKIIAFPRWVDELPALKTFDLRFTRSADSLSPESLMNTLFQSIQQMSFEKDA